MFKSVALFNLNFKVKKILIVILYGSFFASIYFNFKYITILSAMMLSFVDKRNIYVFLIVSPLIIPNQVIFNLTFTQFIVVVFIILFIKDNFHKLVKINSLNILSKLVLLWAVVLIIGFANYSLRYGINIDSVIYENFNRLLTMFLAVLLYIDFQNYSETEKKLTINIISKIVSVIFIVISIDLVINQSVSNAYIWIDGIRVSRISINGLDVNHFAILLSIGFIFPLYNLFFKNGRILISLISCILIVISLVFTYSKTGIVTLVCLIFLFFFFVLNKHFKHKVYALAIFTVLIAFTYILLNEQLEIIISRFTDSFQSGGLVSLTTHRLTLWQNGINATIQSSPLIGLGGSNIVGMNINLLYSGEYIVMHSMIVSQYVEYGLLGLLMYVLLIYYFLKSFFAVLPLIGYEHTKIIFASLFVLFIAGLAINFMYEYTLWVYIGFAFALVKRLDEKEIKYEK